MSEVTLLAVHPTTNSRHLLLVGSSRMANWLDYDGSSIQSKQPAIVGSWPSWWNVGPGCQYNVRRSSPVAGVL
jgi:hypothetical protein